MQKNIAQNAMTVALYALLAPILIIGYFVMVVAMIYMLPGTFASLRRKRYRYEIEFVNLVAGWTLVGWGVAWVLALTPDHIAQLVAKIFFPHGRTDSNPHRLAGLVKAHRDS